MTTDPQSLYTAAYSAHHQDRNLRKAIALYLELLHAHPGTNWASYAQEQMATLEADPAYRTDPAVSGTLKARKEATQSHQAVLERLRVTQSLTIKHVLAEYVGHIIGINAFDPSKVQPAKLIEVQEDHFAVESEAVRVTLPYLHVLKVFSSPAGLVKGGFFGGAYPLVVTVLDLVIYKGAISFGVSMSV